MLLQKSIRKQFFIQLIIASASLILIFTSFSYLYIEKSMYDEKKDELIKFAQNIASFKSIYDATMTNSDTFMGLSVELVHLNTQLEYINMYETTQNDRTYLTLVYPFKLQDLSYLKITRDITTTKKLLNKILNSMFIINSVGFVLIILYAIALSKMLIAPVTTLSKRLSNMNEHLMQNIKIEELPKEFEPLGVTINHLINRIQNFVKYQKELFIGTAHELKTPLAVIKLKNQVTLIKKRTPEEYIEALKTTNKAVDDMNHIVSNILNIGRQEGAQLEKPVEVDIIAVLKEKARDFKLLAENEDKELIMHFEPDLFMATLQVSLLNQIVQNFLQNALKFTPNGKKVTISSYQNNVGLVIEVLDEGCGIDESVDLFAPFKRQGNKSGVGLGLFLAKSAADAIGATIELKNRVDEVSGTSASLTIISKLCCPLHFK
jgi:two-component system OmpR family sensor kinase